MFTLSRNVLVVFLVLLQFFAPLVHAHVDKHFSSAGLHLPGLESHAVASDTPTLQANHCTYSSNNLIVGIESGVTDKLLKLLLDNADSDYIHQPDFVVNSAIVATDSNFSPHPIAIINSLVSPPYAPRAPPLL